LHQPVDGGQKGGQRLAAAGGGGDQRVPALGNGRPALLLRFRQTGKPAAKPLLQQGVKSRKRHGLSLHGGEQRIVAALGPEFKCRSPPGAPSVE